MILYKYVSFEVMLKVIFDSAIGFTPVKYFNDPFESTAFSFENHPTKTVDDKLAAGAFKERINSRFAVLSLTRHPLNSLMWAHYGLSHSGAVIGIEVNEAGLNDPENSLICASEGEVIYSATKPSQTIDIDSFGTWLLEDIETLEFRPSSSNFFKRAFLYKSLEWAYEEEVRIVKSVSINGIPLARGKELRYENHHGVWNKISVENRPLFLFDLPASSIKELYLGSNTYSRNVSQLGNFTGNEFNEIYNRLKNSDIKIYHAQPEFGSWSLEARLDNRSDLSGHPS